MTIGCDGAWGLNMAENVATDDATFSQACVLPTGCTPLYLHAVGAHGWCANKHHDKHPHTALDGVWLAPEATGHDTCAL